MLKSTRVVGVVVWGGAGHLIANMETAELQTILTTKLATIRDKRRIITQCESDLRFLKNSSRGASLDDKDNREAQERIQEQIAAAQFAITWMDGEVKDIEAALGNKERSARNT